MNISKDIARADGLAPELCGLTEELVDTWQRHLKTNQLRDAYYNSDNPLKDLGVSVSAQMKKKLQPHIDWAAKCVNWWADHVQFTGFVAKDEILQGQIDKLCKLNDIDNLVQKVVQSSLRHSVAFITVTKGNQAWQEPDVVLSGYPATAASAIYSNAKKRIEAGLVVVDTKYSKSKRKNVPTLMYLFDDETVTVLTLVQGRWVAQTTPHNMGRVPMEHLSYHATLERPFGSSRISRTVMSLVDDAQRELMNMSACAAFSAAPQKFILGADPELAKKLAETPFGAYVGSLAIITPNKQNQTPQMGQLPQLQMQPHADYIRILAALFSDATNVPLSSLGFSGANPTSAESLIASQEDAIVDINNYISAAKRTLSNVAIMAAAQLNNTSYQQAAKSYDIACTFANPATPSVVSVTNAAVQKVGAFPWMAQSDVLLRDMGYKGETLEELRDDRRKFEAQQLMMQTVASQARDRPNDTSDDTPEE